MNRARSLDRLRNDGPFDMLVLGGGATGLATAVDAAARGYRVGLVEARDFAQGTSSRSTKLVHGGVRYLKQGDVSLVLEALRERGRLARNAPHLVHDLQFVIPVYRAGDGVFYGAGLKLYEALAGRLSLGPSRVLSRAETEALLPGVVTEGLRGGVLYHDAQFDDARLAITLARTADALGAAVANHCRCTGFSWSGGRVVGAEVVDVETGAAWVVRAKAVVNATGVFVDGIRRLEEPDCAPLVAVSQGVHLVLPRAFLPGDAALMVPRTRDGRVLFAVPWKGKVVLGTTDTPREAPEEEPQALPEEIAFLLEHAARYLARAPTEADVTSVFAGLRPLVRAGRGRATKALSRDHVILVGRGGVVTVTGGKWTTCRKMGEDVVDAAARVAGLEERESRTVGLALHGAGGTPVPGLEVYGSDGPAVARLGSLEPLDPDLPYSEAEVRWAVRHEMARTVDDILARRTRATFLDTRAAARLAPRVAALLAEERGSVKDS